jgi:hypothetical protein
VAAVVLNPAIRRQKRSLGDVSGQQVTSDVNHGASTLKGGGRGLAWDPACVISGRSTFYASCAQPTRALARCSFVPDGPGYSKLALHSLDKHLAENQLACRSGNERLRGAVEARAGGEPIPFLCECTDGTCLARVDLTLEEYRGIRRHENRFVILRDHPTLPGERIVEEKGFHQVVEKYRSVAFD